MAGELAIAAPNGEAVDSRIGKHGVCQFGGDLGNLARGCRSILRIGCGLAWHHRDPFDRMLVAQAEEDRLVLLTADETSRANGPMVRVSR